VGIVVAAQSRRFRPNSPNPNILSLTPSLNLSLTLTLTLTLFLTPTYRHSASWEVTVSADVTYTLRLFILHDFESLKHGAAGMWRWFWTQQIIIVMSTPRGCQSWLLQWVDWDDFKTLNSKDDTDMWRRTAGRRTRRSDIRPNLCGMSELAGKCWSVWSFDRTNMHRLWTNDEGKSRETC